MTHSFTGAVLELKGTWKKGVAVLAATLAGNVTATLLAVLTMAKGEHQLLGLLGETERVVRAARDLADLDVAQRAHQSR